ncbi:MAG: periplasmic heavy metal sensor, partial [Candidatus Omnitrophica bacterium]|nr:periplasmic heavy metal sensor [Candidatus Omnitrophota bacterium]
MHGGFLNHPEVQKKLGLSDDQIQKLKANQREMQKHRIKLQADTEIARMELEELLRADEMDKAAIDQHVNSLGDLHKQGIQGMVDHLLAVRDILDSTQLEKVQGFMDRMRGPRGDEGKGAWKGKQGDRRGGEMREGRRGRGEGPPRQGPPEDRGRRWKSDDDRGDGPPPPPRPREGRAPRHEGGNAPEGFGQGPGPFGPPPAGFGQLLFDEPKGQDDFADLGPALD